MMEEKLNLLLIERFPILEEKYKEEVSWQEGDATGSHTVYGDVFNPFARDFISNRNDEMVKKIFEFIEELLALNNEYAEELVVTTILEGILESEDDKKYALKFAGKITNNYI